MYYTLSITSISTILSCLIIEFIISTCTFINKPLSASPFNHCCFISSVGTLTRIDLPGFLAKNLEIASKAVFVFSVVIS